MGTEGKLAGKKAIVTGSGTGIGREVALEFARQGADVVLHYAHAAAGAESAAEEVRSMGRQAPSSRPISTAPTRSCDWPIRQSLSWDRSIAW